MQDNIDKNMSFLQKLLSLQRKYGFFDIIKSLILLLITGYVVFFTLNPTYLLDKIEKLQVDKHSEAISKRVQSDKDVRLILERLLESTDADRAWLVEFHNGSSNIATGLPFLYGSMRIEATRDSILSIEDDYSDFSLSRYPLMYKLMQDGYYYGSVDSIVNIDKRLYYKMKSNNVNEFAALTLYDGNSPIGVIGLSFCVPDTMNLRIVGKEIRRGGMQIGAALSK